MTSKWAVSEGGGELSVGEHLITPSCCRWSAKETLERPFIYWWGSCPTSLIWTPPTSSATSSFSTLKRWECMIYMELRFDFILYFVRVTWVSLRLWKLCACRADTLLSMKHGLGRLDNVWGVGKGSCRKWSEIKKSEYFMKKYGEGFLIDCWSVVCYFLRRAAQDLVFFC